MGKCGCDSYRPGHNCHQIQARLASSDPSSWFAATVIALDQDLTTVEYADRSTCVIWRHGGLNQRCTAGSHVFVTESWALISVPGAEHRSLLSIEVRECSWCESELPADRPRVAVAGIVDFSIGEGIDLVHRE
jgi:hypothetical protein